MPLGDRSLSVVSDDPVFADRLSRAVNRGNSGFFWSGWLPFGAVADGGETGLVVVDGGEQNAYPAHWVGRNRQGSPGAPLLIYAYMGEPPPDLGEDVRGILSRTSPAELFLAAARAVNEGLAVSDTFPLGSPRQEQPGRLTPREIEVLRLVARGMPDKGVAFELGISARTVKFHIAQVRAKLDAASRAEAVAVAASLGLLPL